MSEHANSNDGEQNTIDAATQRQAVRDRYGDIASEESDCCSDSCCEDDAEDDDRGTELGYTDDDVAAVAEGANLNLGCGNPTALAELQTGEAVLDLGSGGGFDCFLAAREVGDTGRVIGVDMTPEMVEKARENVMKNDAENVEFRLGEIEHLPVSNTSVDVVISNCVINLSPDKPQVFDEAYRVLRPGGRLRVSDVVLTADLPGDVRADPESVAACIAGASTVNSLEEMMRRSGFESIAISPKEDSEEFIREWDDERDLSEYVIAATIEAEKPVQR